MRKVLIIENARRLLQIISDFLNKKGFDVISADNSSSGIQKALECLPDIILCDNELTNLNAYEIYNTLQQINSTAVIPFIFLIGTTENEYVRLAMDLGADGFIKKPIQLNELLTLINVRLAKQDKIMGVADQKFNTLMDYSSNAIFIYCDAQLNYVNNKFCELFMYNKSHLLGMNLINFVYKDDIRLVAEKIEKGLHGIFNEQEIQFRIITKNDNIVKLNVQLSRVTLRGKNSLIGTVLASGSKNGNSVVGQSKTIQYKITNREKEILKNICDGKTNREIGELLGISERTVEGHRINLLKKTESRNSATLAIFAVKNNLYQIK
ncbi:MAG: response regulator [Bacteroidetes bacterium]|nr:response regulator [Bacteroidota bacterium]